MFRNEIGKNRNPRRACAVRGLCLVRLAVSNLRLSIMDECLMPIRQDNMAVDIKPELVAAFKQTVSRER